MITWLKSLAKVTLYQPLFNALIFLVWLVPDHNVGWAIILLTLLVRVALYPLNAKMIRSQQALAALQPEIERIRREYKDDQQAQARATLELYQSKGASPFGSCGLLLVQLPVLWVLYKVFTVGLDTSRFDLLYSFTPRPETIQILFFGIDLTHPSLILGVLAGLAQFLQTRQTMAKQLATKPAQDSDPADQAAQTQAMVSKQMLYLFPIMTIVLSRSFPAALTLYWLVTTLAMAAQQWWITRATAELATVPEVSVTVRNS